MLDPDRLNRLMPIETHQSYCADDTILYALGVGVSPASDPDTLKFVFEDGLQALPTMAVVLGYPGFWQREEKYGIDWRKVLHAGQSIVLHRPLAPQAEIVATTGIEALVDKGRDKGAILVTRREIHDKPSGAHLATVLQTSLLRGDGGFGSSTGTVPFSQSVPEREPDITVDSPTWPNQALIYRLSGDRNPLHADPRVAEGAGFPRPILHGLCTYGIAGAAVLATVCGNDPDRLKRFDVRFTSPAYPGETIRTHIWKGEGHAFCVSRVVERDIQVLGNGYVELRTQ